MFRFFKKKPAPTADAPADAAVPSPLADGPAAAVPGQEPTGGAASPAPAEGGGWWRQAVGKITGRAAESPGGAPLPAPVALPESAPRAGLDAAAPTAADAAAPTTAPTAPAPAEAAPLSPVQPDRPAAAPAAPNQFAVRPAPAPAVTPPAAIQPADPVPPDTAAPDRQTARVEAAAEPLRPAAAVAPPAKAKAESEALVPASASASAPVQERQSWMGRLRRGLSRTGQSLAQVFTGTRIDDALYEELEDALLMADAGVKATQFLLEDLKRRVKEARVTDPAAVKGQLVDALADLLAPLEKGLEIGRHEPTVMMVVGVNGAGKTTSIGKLTKHLAEADQTVLLAAADTFRAAAREQLGVWADRNKVEIVSQAGADPAAVSFDAVTAGKARKRDVVIADTAGRLPTQIHLMEELKKIQRVIGKADAGAPHEVLLVVDGNTGQNALTQVKAFDDALKLTGLIVTKLDGTAKGGVLAAIARERPVPVYFIGVGEQIEDLQTFSAREFAQALLN